MRRSPRFPSTSSSYWRVSRALLLVLFHLLAASPGVRGVDSPARAAAPALAPTADPVLNATDQSFTPIWSLDVIHIDYVPGSPEYWEQVEQQLAPSPAPSAEWPDSAPSPAPSRPPGGGLKPAGVPDPPKGWPEDGVTFNLNFIGVRYKGRFDLTERKPSFEYQRDTITRQIKQVNADFKIADIQFKRGRVMWRERLEWARACSEHYHDDIPRVVKTLQTCDLYVIVCNLENNELGVQLSWPFVAIDYDTVPGSPRKYYNQGKTLSHELGHAFSLRHVWDGGCTDSGGGDGVRDTPAQGEPNTGGCTQPFDSCPDQPGRDNLFNLMNYNHDSCMYGFSIGQVRRMQEYLVNERPDLVEACATKPPARRPR